MSRPRLVLSFFPLAALAFAVAFVAFEHFSGGVKTHHFLARGDLPGFSNWLSLIILPILGIVVAYRAHSLRAKQTDSALPSSFNIGIAGSLVYGAALAISFLLGLKQVTVVLFFGLFLVAVVLPAYRAEYIFGFVLGMTIAFGSAIPMVLAVVFSALSFVVRSGARFVLSALRRRGS